MSPSHDLAVPLIGIWMFAAADFFEYAPPEGGIDFGYDYT